MFTDECSANLKQDLTLMGYGMMLDGMKYWLIKDSCGSCGGRKGYMKIERDVAPEEGILFEL